MRVDLEADAHRPGRGVGRDERHRDRAAARRRRTGCRSAAPASAGSAQSAVSAAIAIRAHGAATSAGLTRRSSGSQRCSSETCGAPLSSARRSARCRRTNAKRNSPPPPVNVAFVPFSSTLSIVVERQPVGRRRRAARRARAGRSAADPRGSGRRRTAVRAARRATAPRSEQRRRRRCWRAPRPRRRASAASRERRLHERRRAPLAPEHRLAVRQWIRRSHSCRMPPAAGSAKGGVELAGGEERPSGTRRECHLPNGAGTRQSTPTRLDLEDRKIRRVRVASAPSGTRRECHLAEALVRERPGRLQDVGGRERGIVEMVETMIWARRDTARS